MRSMQESPLPQAYRRSALACITANFRQCWKAYALLPMHSLPARKPGNCLSNFNSGSNTVFTFSGLSNRKKHARQNRAEALGLARDYPRRA